MFLGILFTSRRFINSLTNLYLPKTYYDTQINISSIPIIIRFIVLEIVLYLFIILFFAKVFL